MLGDPDQLDALATRLRGQAEEVRTLADDHVRAGDLAHWVSDSGDAYRGKLVDDRLTAHAAADQMDEAAALINAQADAVRDRLAAIAAAAAAAVEVARDAAGEVVETAEELAHGVRDIGSGIVDDVSGGLDLVFDND